MFVLVAGLSRRRPIRTTREGVPVPLRHDGRCTGRGLTAAAARCPVGRSGRAARDPSAPGATRRRAAPGHHTNRRMPTRDTVRSGRIEARFVPLGTTRSPPRESQRSTPPRMAHTSAFASARRCPPATARPCAGRPGASFRSSAARTCFSAHPPYLVVPIVPSPLPERSGSEFWPRAEGRELREERHRRMDGTVTAARARGHRPAARLRLAPNGKTRAPRPGARGRRATPPAHRQPRGTSRQTIVVCLERAGTGWNGMARSGPLDSSAVQQPQGWMPHDPLRPPRPIARMLT